MALTEIPSELSSTPSIVDNGNATAITIGSDESATFAGSVSISHGAGDSLTLTKTTTEPSLRLEGDTNKDFVITVSGELLTITQNDGSTDLLTLDHDTKGATFSSTVTATGLTVNTDANSSVVIKDVGTNAIAMFAAAGDELYLGGNNTYSLRLKADGNVAMDNGANLSFSAGHGIDFSANANAAGASSELLDGYEEGTWTPACSISALSVSRARYVRIGGVVHLSCTITTSGTMSTGTFQLTGLPYTGINTAHEDIGSVMSHNVGFGGYNQMVSYKYSGSGAIQFYLIKDNAAWALLQGQTGINTSEHIIMSITYKVF